MFGIILIVNYLLFESTAKFILLILGQLGKLVLQVNDLFVVIGNLCVDTLSFRHQLFQFIDFFQRVYLLLILILHWDPNNH